MDIDRILSASVLQRLPPGEGETQCRGPPGSSLDLLPFHPSTSNLPALEPPPSLLPVVIAGRDLALKYSDLSSQMRAPVEVRPQTPRISAAVSGPWLTLGSVEPAPALINLDPVEIQEMKVFAGPNLFLDDGME